MEFVVLESRESVESVVADLVRGSFVNDETVSRRADIARVVGEFFGTRYAASANEYHAWKLREGYVPLDIQELRSTWFINEAYETYFKNAIPNDVSWDELHIAMLDAQAKFESGRLYVREIATTPDSVASVTKRLTRSDPEMPMFPGVAGELLDTGGSRSIGASWWRPPRTIDELLDSDGFADVCSIGMIVRFGDGEWRPLGIMLVRDSHSARWMHSSLVVGTNKFREIKGLRIEY